MRVFRRSVAVVFAACAALLVLGPAATRHVNAESDKLAPLIGAWTVNKELSDDPRDQGTGHESRDRGRRGGGGGFGRGGGGGRRGGGFGGGQPASSDPEQAERMRAALRDVMNLPDHVTIVEAGSLIVITGADGRTTRLSPDGKKIKDESTKSERKTVWTDGRLVSEISGLGAGKITQTISVDPDRHQMRVAVQMEHRPAIVRVYDADSGHQGRE
jgi:hypothetical protein